MTDEFEKRLQELSRQTFEKKLASLDVNTRNRLKASRQLALEKCRGKKKTTSTTVTFPAWLPPVSTATAFTSVALVVTSLWFQPEFKPQTLMTPLDDIALLSSTEELEFFENLDFYIWLEDEVNNDIKHDKDAS